MPISSLPDSTVRAIGSSLVLNDASSVVKELIDNALDATASSIVVEISANTLDVIQVKDNGSGIGIEDRQLLCKHGCTSKIRSMSDLSALGGTFLGFRGQALSSLAKLSESVIITTRIDGEVTGSTLRFGPKGVLLSSSSASHPTGTTFRVQNFLQRLPVRKQTAKKSASITLSRINKLLRSYAFARPNVRYSLRVLRAKNEKSNWDYSPQINKTCLLDVMGKVVGRDIAAWCEIRSATDQSSQPEGSQPEQSYMIEAALPKACDDLSKVSNSDCYISVDGRPMNPERGTIRDIVKLHRSYYRASSRTTGRMQTIRPFLCLHMRFPPSSYDVNVEPAKDDLLFSYPLRLVSLAEQLFKEFYGKIDTAGAENTFPSEEANKKTPSSLDLLLARKQPLPNVSKLPSETPGRWPRLQREDIKTPRNMTLLKNVAAGPRQESAFEEIALHDTRKGQIKGDLDDRLEGQERIGKKAYTNMFSIDETDLLEGESVPDVEESLPSDEDEHEIRSIRVTNPWSLAKLNTPTNSSTKPFRDPENSPSKEQFTTPLMDQISPLGELDEVAPQNRRVTMGLNTPAASSSPMTYQSPGPLVRQRQYQTGGRVNDEFEFTQDKGSWHERSSCTLLDFGVGSSSKPTQELASFRKASTFVNVNDRTDSLPLRSCDMNQGMLGENSLSGALLTEKTRQSFDGHRKLFRISKRTSEEAKMTVGHAHEGRSDCAEASTVTAQPNIAKVGPFTDLVSSRPGRECDPRPISSAQRLFEASQDSAAELNDILEFERRKKAINIQHRKFTAKFISSNPARLAAIQRKAILSHPSFQNNLPKVDLREELSNPTRETIHHRRGGQDADAEETNFRSPHENRYLASKARLHPNGDASSASPHANFKNVCTISPGESCGYLVRHIDPKEPNASLKICRTQTSRLPLETIPPASAVHNLATTINPTLTGIQCAFIVVAETDAYPLTGSVEPMHWSPAARDIPAWEARLRELTRGQYVARVGNDGEQVMPELAFALQTAFKMHKELNGL